MTIALAAAAALALATGTGVDRTIEVSGVKLHIACDGARTANAPLVVLEAGAGNSAATWRDVFAPIARFVRVCAYDRVNLGSSDAYSPRLTGAAHAEMLHALLDAAHEPAPYVLAGHSYGGMIVRLFASRYPREVAGLVLVDSSHEDQLARFAVLPPPQPATPAPPAPSGVGTIPVAGSRRPREQIDLAATSAELAKASWRADIPLVVLSRGVWTTTAPAVPDPLAQTRLWIWQDLHRELATRSPRAELVVATKSGHYIQNDEPQIVVDAVRRVVGAATRSPS